MEVKIEDSWKKVLQDEFEKEYFKELTAFVKQEYALHTVYPPGKNIFSAFDYCPFHQLKVVILGQDPYHGPGQAHGLCFSVNEGIAHPPSLRNIFKEINNDLNIPVPVSGNLEHWARQGVLLLNATLTVRSGEAGSHQGKGWEVFTDAVIAKVAALSAGTVFLLWGAYAQKKAALIDTRKHLILSSVHPSPLSASRGFFGNKHFSGTNEYLRAQGKEGILW